MCCEHVQGTRKARCTLPVLILARGSPSWPVNTLFWVSPQQKVSLWARFNRYKADEMGVTAVSIMVKLRHGSKTIIVYTQKNWNEMRLHVIAICPKKLLVWKSRRERGGGIVSLSSHLKLILVKFCIKIRIVEQHRRHSIDRRLLCKHLNWSLFFFFFLWNVFSEQVRSHFVASLSRLSSLKVTRHWRTRLTCQSPKFLVASICDLPDVINCQLREFAVAPLGAVHFLSQDQQSGIYCLVIWGIQLLTLNNLSGTWRRTCSQDIRSVSALSVAVFTSRSTNRHWLTYLLTYLLTLVAINWPH